MPEGRIVLKSISESKKLSMLKTDGARLLYTWLIPHVDIRGCYSGDPIVINGKILTRLGKSNKEVETYLDDMHRVGLITRYEHNNDQYIQLPDFTDKQPYLNPHREAKPKIPTPEELGVTQDKLMSNSGPTHDEFMTNSYTSKREIESKSKSKSKYTCEFDLFWSNYPRKVGKEPTWKAWKKRNGDRPDIETLLKALEEQKRSDQWQKDGGQFVPMPATWLNQGRWADELEGKGGIWEWLKTTSEE